MPDNQLRVRSVFPDLKLNIEYQIAEGDWVATTYSVTGTFRKEWLGMKPTGKIIEHGGAANLLDHLINAGVIIKSK